jgi:hypothetical protein
MRGCGASAATGASRPRRFGEGTEPCHLTGLSTGTPVAKAFLTTLRRHRLQMACPSYDWPRDRTSIAAVLLFSLDYEVTNKYETVGQSRRQTRLYSNLERAVGAAAKIADVLLGD